MTAGTKKRKLFYGYIVVIAGFFASWLILGTYRAYGVFFTPLIKEFGWSSELTSGAYSLTYFIQGLLAIVAGHLTDRWGPKVILTGCGIILGIGYFLMSQVHAAWQLYLYFGVLVGIGNSGVDVTIMATIVRWFKKRRGTMSGITKAGAGVGMLVMPIAAGLLITGNGWRQSYIVVAIMCLVGVVAAAWFFKRDPAQLGDYPDGLPPAEEPGNKPSVDNYHFTLGEILRTRPFWIFSIAWFFLSFCIQIVMLDTAPHAINLGISQTIAATILGTIGASSILGRLGMGSISDRLGNKKTFLIAISIMVAALTLMQFANQSWTFFTFTFLYGIAHGALFTLLAPILAELYGLRSIGSSTGMVMFISTAGGAIGPIVSGRIFDITHSYQPGFLIGLVFLVIALVLTAMLRPGRVAGAKAALKRI